MKKETIFASVLVVLFSLSVSDAESKEKWAFGCSGAGSAPYVWGATISKIVNKHQDVIQISPQATAGYNENIALVSGGDIQIAQQTGPGYLDAWSGKEVFKKAEKRLRLLFVFSIAPYHLVTREAAKIRSISDLKGKKMNIALPAQTTRTFNECFLEAAGLKVSDIQVFEMATGQTFTAMQDGVIDASGNLYSLGHGGLLELTTNTDIRLLDLPADVVNRFLKLRPGCLKVTIPANTYKGTDYPVHTIGATSVIFCRDDLAEKLVYTFTKTFWENLAELNKEPGFKDLKKDLAYSNEMGVPYHPGALKYFKEAGLI